MEDHGSSVLGTAMQEKRAHHHIAETNNTAQMVQGHLEFGRPVHLDFHCLMVKVKIRPFRHDIERIQELTHMCCSHLHVLILILDRWLADTKERGLQGSHTSRFPNH